MIENKIIDFIKNDSPIYTKRRSIYPIISYCNLMEEDFHNVVNKSKKIIKVGRYYEVK